MKEGRHKIPRHSLAPQPVLAVLPARSQPGPGTRSVNGGQQLLTRAPEQCLASAPQRPESVTEEAPRNARGAADMIENSQENPNRTPGNAQGATAMIQRPEHRPQGSEPASAGAHHAGVP